MPGRVRPLFARVFLAAVCVATFAASATRAEVLGLERVADSLTNPVYVTAPPGDSGRLFILEQAGIIKILNLQTLTVNATAFLTIPDTDAAGDGGLMGMAFHPEFAVNRRFFVYVTVDNGGILIDGVTSPFSSHVREYTASVADPDIADVTPLEIVSWVQPRANHNAGWIGFDPTDVAPSLYIMSGDGGKQGDPDNNAQTLSGDLLGKALRIGVEGDDFPVDPTRNYTVPVDNPFVGIAGDDEIWSYGLRNPWRASFDRELGDLWIGDVGQSSREEIDFQSSSNTGGDNYAWNRREGLIAHQGGALLPGDVEPVYDYTHGSGALQGHSTVGGYVYRGFDSDLRGLYFFGDTISGNIWTFDPANPSGTVVRINSLLVPDVGTLDLPVSFGEDALGNLYIVDYNSANGEIFRISTNGPEVPGLTGRGLIALSLGMLLVASWMLTAGRTRAGVGPIA